jgi:hypothetical protein
VERRLLRYIGSLALLADPKTKLARVTRVPIPPLLRKKIEQNNAEVCCVCWRTGIGTNIHHIDGDHANNDPSNLALVCVKEHDAHHRPHAYHPRHALTAEDLRGRKRDWEAFVARARSMPPKVLAMINGFGVEGSVHAIRLSLQDETGKVGFERDYHLLNILPEEAMDEVLRTIEWLNPHIKIYITPELASIDYCSCKAQKSLTPLPLPVFAARELSSDWGSASMMIVYVNPDQPSCAAVLSYKDNVPKIEWSLHRCGMRLILKEVYAADAEARETSYRIPRGMSSRRLAADIIAELVERWKPGQYVICTGDPDNPRLIDELAFPRSWDSRPR